MACCNDWALKQANWYVDPQNTTGTADDGNVGNDPAYPVLSYNGGIVAKWGTTAPMLAQDTTITWLSSQGAGGQDPVVCNPVMTAGAVLTLQGQLTNAQKVHSGTLSNVTAKNRATPQLLAADIGFTPTAGSFTLLKNTQSGKSSFAWVYTNVSGTKYNLSQPLAPMSMPVIEFPTLAEVDTWANSDSFEAYQLTQVHIACVEPIAAEFNSGGGFPAPVQIYQLHMMSPDGVNSDNNVYIAPGVSITECSADVLLSARMNNDDLISNFTNCCFGAGADYSSPNVATSYMFGGIMWQQLVCGRAGWSWDYDVIIDGIGSGDHFTIGAVSVNTGFGVSCVGLAYFADQVDAQGIVSFYDGGSRSGSCRVWGPGRLNLVGTCRAFYKSGATGAATVFLIPELRLNGQTSGNTFTPSTGTWGAAAGSPITATTLDTKLGAGNANGAFGNVGGAFFTSQPKP